MLNRTLTPHSMINGNACFAYFNKIWGIPPQFAFKPGRDVIQKHYQGIIDAGATGITLELKNVELRGNDGVWAAGTYSVTVKDKTIQGNWFRILKRENGTWKIAMEAFARAGVIDAPPAAAPPNSK